MWGVNLNHLRYFVAVATELSFTRAAQRMHVVQSAISAAIRSLEKDLGAELFDRSGRHVALTGAGEALLPRAVATLDAAQEGRDAVLATQGRLHGTLHIGGMISVGLLDVPALLGRYHRLHPDVTLRLQMSPLGSAGHVRGLLAGDLDVAFAALGGRAPAGLVVRELATVRMLLVTPADHPLAERTGIDLHELADESFVDSPVGYGNRDVVDRAFAAAGVDRRVAVEAIDIGTVSAFVRHGLGIAFLPEFAIAPDAEDLAVLSTGGENLDWSLSMATSATRRTTAALGALLSVVDTELGDLLHLPQG